MGFDTFSEILRILRARNEAFSQRFKEADAVKRWEDAVGPGIAKHARAVLVKQGVLWVEVDHPIWRSELHHRKSQILEKLNASAENKGEKVIQDLFFMDPRRRRNPSAKD